jgi:hypothetical protein
MRSADNLFPYVAAHSHRKHAAVDLREVGAWKWLATASTCVLLMAQRMRPEVRLGLSKQQYGALSLARAALAAAAIAHDWREWGKAAMVLAGGFAAPLTFNALNATSSGLVGAANAANKTDTFL